MPKKKQITRRDFIRGSVALAGAFALPTIVPRRVLGGPGNTPPSEIVTRAIIGTGARGMVYVRNGPNKPDETPSLLAVCDVYRAHLDDALAHAGPGCRGYSDYRHVLDRKDIDVVYVVTPPHWHSLISVHAAQAGKDIYCEKPMTKFIHEGRVMADAMERYGAMLQIATSSRFREDTRRMRKLVMSGLLGSGLLVRMPRSRYDWKVSEWSGRTDLKPEPVPDGLNWDMWLGPAPYKPYHPQRCWGHFRGYWDYDGGGFADMGAHFFDGIQYIIGADNSGPVEIESKAPWPQHPDAVGMWGSITYRFPNDITVRCTSGEWGDETDDHDAPFIEGSKGKLFHGLVTDPPGLLEESDKLPDPPVLPNLDEAIRQRRQPGGNAEVSHRVSTILHLGNISVRLGRKLQWDPVKEQFVNDAEANRLVNVPMRAPWQLDV